MIEQFNLEFEGREYTVQGGEPPASAAQGGGAPVGRGSWYISLGYTAITRLDAVPEETRDALCDRIRGWLAEHPEMPDTEGMVLGGG